MMLDARNSNTWEVKAGGLEVQSQPQLHSKVNASLGYSLGYMRPYFREQTEAMEMNQ